MDKSILIIDDDKNIIQILSELVADQFTIIDSASTVDEALGHINKSKYDIIILDINLEGRNGAEIIKFLIEDKNNSNSNSAIVINSGIINESFISKNKNRFAGILVKPFEHDEVIQMMSKILLGQNGEAENELPPVTCTLPFTIPQLEVKVSKVMEQIKKNNKLKELFAKMQINRDESNYLLEHVGMIINISTAISISLEWNTEKTLEKFVYAAYLHDMALNERPDLARIATFNDLENLKGKLSAADYKLVMEHTNAAASKIEEINEIPSDVAQIVRQHHENPKETGFPNKLSASKISPLSSIFIVAHDLTDYILNNPNWTMEKYLARYKLTFKGQHFNKISQALEKIKS